MAKTLRYVADAELVAVASPTPGRADAFGDEHDVDLRFGHPSDLAGNVDVAYVGSSHHRHLHDVIALIDVGIPILCEKALATNVDDAVRMVEHARSNGVFLMEAMWMRFLPFWDRLVTRIDDGTIGRLRTVTSRFDITASPDPARRWFDPTQGGGALLDVGIYPLSLAASLAGPPTSISAEGMLGDTGVDVQVAVVMAHASDVLSVSSASFVSERAIVATISGSRGRIEVAEPFHHPPSFSVYRDGALAEHVDTTFAGPGYRFEVEEVHRCLDVGVTESPTRPLEDTLEVMRIIDEARRLAFAR